MALGRSRYSPKRSAPSTARNRAFASTAEMSNMATSSAAITVSMGVQLHPNSVKSLLLNPFERRTFAEKLQVKELGPDKPEVNINQETREKDKASYKRSFSRGWFDRKAWLTRDANAIFCFPCILFKTGACDNSWTQTGVTDLKHLSERIKKHERARVHMNNCVKLAMLGRISIAAQLDEGHRIAVRRHNEEVDRNRHILSKIIDAGKFSGAFELPLRGHDESETSENPGIFRGLIDLVATSNISKIGQFFSDIGGFSSFFHKSFKRTAVLDEVVGRRLPGASTTRWNFHSRAVNTVYEHKDELVKCFQTIRDRGDFDAMSKREAGGLLRMLEDEAFCFFLALFHKIMPHVDMLFNQLQKRNIDSVFIAGITQKFTQSIQAIR